MESNQSRGGAMQTRIPIMLGLVLWCALAVQAAPQQTDEIDETVLTEEEEAAGTATGGMVLSVYTYGTSCWIPKNTTYTCTARCLTGDVYVSGSGRFAFQPPYTAGKVLAKGPTGDGRGYYVTAKQRLYSTSLKLTMTCQ
jgi:hypothetical protein